jgi:hypothetical protein
MSTCNTHQNAHNRFDAEGRFILPDFQQKRAFSSFLPGIAGLHGIPMWVFYVNRGQAICSFGVENKDHPILEFQAANRAYQSTPLLGFRTFLNGSREGTTWNQEAFALWQPDNVQRTMFIGMNEVEIQEVNTSLGYQINVLYFTLPNEPFSGLIRRVNLNNLMDTPLVLEVLDGLPGIIPYGVDNGALKHIGRTIEAWMKVDNLENRLPFYRLKATPGDTAEVSAIPAGNYAFAFSDGELLPAVADPAVIFGLDTSLSRAYQFHEGGLENMLNQTQTLEGRTLSAFFCANRSLLPGETTTITSLYGFTKDLSTIETNVPRLIKPGTYDQKLIEGRRLALDLTDAIKTESASPIFDAYARQTYLDNLLRGGQPLVLGNKHVYHVYSRKHGDIERDYNFFNLGPEYYSQGNGNYRDINQNRRSDVFFVPQAGLSNIQLFMSLIQADGYNPLVINRLTFSIPPTHKNSILSLAEKRDGLAELFERRFTPGELYETALVSQISLSIDDFLHHVFTMAEAHVQAEHGEGYWIDHWTYNLDLIQAYLAIYPEKKSFLLFDADPLPFFDSSYTVRPRHERFVLSQGKPRQLNAVVEDPEKAALLQTRETDRHWARSGQGQGEIFRLPLFSKLTLLAILKFASLDPGGMGIQMEAGRPGWYDALNGLPGLFGSSMPETCELLRLIRFLLDNLTELSPGILMPLEVTTIIEGINTSMQPELEAFEVWEKMTDALETYRQSVRMGFDGEILSLDLSELLSDMCTSLERGIEKSNAFMDGIPPTYFIYEAVDYDLTETTDSSGRLYIQVKGFKPSALPAFLEGPVRLMKISSKPEVRSLYENVRKSDLYDSNLGMYKVNSSLKRQSHEIGRAHAFTPGWLENESIWMHMAFKYLLELQRAGLYEQFFSELQAHLPAFMNPDIYGRSLLENSSFIVSSAHPDPTLHGNGFVARMSGSTAEFLSMWVLMTTGEQPFRVEDGKLVLEFKPKLPGWLFKEDGTFLFRFLGSCDVTVHNPARKDTFSEGLEATRILLRSHKETTQIKGSEIRSPFAERVRKGEFESIELFLE